MITFLAPTSFLLFVFVPLFILLFMGRSAARQRALSQIGDPQLVARLTTRLIPGARLLKSSLWIGAITLLIVALARPTWGSITEIRAPVGAEVVLLIDVSRSMDATDTAPSRLERAKLDALSLTDQLPTNAIGITLFAGTALPYMPMTIDTDTAAIFVNSITTDALPIQGTALAAALSAAVTLFDENPETPASVILFTDGEDHQGDLDVALQALNQENVTVYAFGYGTDAGSTIPLKNTAEGLKRDVSGTLVVTRLDFRTLEDIAAATNGLALRAVNEEAAVQIALLIQQQQGDALSPQVITRPVEQFPLFLLLAAGLLLASLKLPETRSEVT